MTHGEHPETARPLDRPDRGRFVASLAAAAVVLILFSAFGDLFSVRLRELSSAVAAALLRAFSFPATREGTILTVGVMRFDVVPACSGSNSLQALIVLGLIWCGLHPRLSLARKLVAMLLALPVALFANGVRVAVLAAASTLTGQRIEEGFLHYAVGAIGFLLALGGFLLLTEALARRRPSPQRMTTPEVSLAFTVPLLLLVFVPFLMKCLGDWRGNLYNRLDVYGYLFFFAGLAAFLAAWRRRPGDTRFSGPGSLLFLAALSPLVLSLLRSPSGYAMGASLLLVLFALGLAFKGPAFAVKTLPLLVVMGLGYPKVTSFLNGALGMAGIRGALIVKTAAALSLVGVTAALLGPRPARALPPGAGHGFRFALIPLAALCVLAVQVLNIQLRLEPERIPLRMSYLQGRWVGEDRPLEEKEQAFFQGQNVLNRLYRNGGEQAGLLVISSSCDRKKIHPPEYCQTGAGWIIQDRVPFAFEDAGGRRVEATRLELRRENPDLDRTMVYWFSDGEKSFADYPSLVMEDFRKMLSPRKPEWFLFAAWTDQGEPVLQRFLSGLQEPESLPHPHESRKPG